MSANGIDDKIRRLAAHQHYVASRRQLLEMGVSEKAIRHRISTRRLIRVHSGVYTIHPKLGHDGRCMAAVLACGEEAVLSHRSAADLWELRASASDRIDVTIPRRGSSRPGISVHTSRLLVTEDITVRRKIPCTTVARTLLDLAGCLNRRALGRAVEQSMILQLYDHAALLGVLSRASGKTGAAALRSVIADLSDNPLRTRSELERRFLELVRQARLPMPVVNGMVCGYEVDFHWPRYWLIVECDGRSIHSTPHAFDRDRRRDLELELQGWRVIRLTWRQIVHEPKRVVALMRKRLES